MKEARRRPVPQLREDYGAAGQGMGVESGFVGTLDSKRSKYILSCEWLQNCSQGE